MGISGISILVFFSIFILVFQPFSILPDVSAASISAKISSFRLESTTLKPDDRLNVYLDVQNTGSDDHRFYVGFSIITPSGNVIDMPYRSLSLDPNETDDVRFDWRIPRDAQSGSYTAIVAVWEDESGGLLQNRLADQRKSFTVEGFRIDADISSLSIGSSSYKPGDRVEVRVDVRNTGNTDHRFYVGFSIRDSNGRIIDISPNSLSLDPSETDYTTFSWYIPQDAPSGSYEAIVAVWEDKSGSEMINRLADQRRNFTVEGFRIDAEISSLRVDRSSFKPGDSVNVYVDVRNTGNTDHYFYVGFSIRDPNGNWIDISPNSLSLDNGETDDTSFRWTVPKDAPSGSYEIVTAVWESRNGDYLQNRLDERRTSFSVEGFRIDADISSLSIGSNTYKPGDRVEVRVDVRNTGNTDHRFYVGFSVRTPSGSIIDIPYRSLSLDPNETDYASFSWYVPKEAPSGSYEAITAVWQGESQGLLQSRLAEQRSSFTVEGFRIDADITSLNIGSSSYKPGDRVEVRVDVRNTGNTDHRFYVGFSIRDPNGRIIDISPNSLSLSTTKTDYTSFSWYIPQDASGGSYEAIVAVWEDKSGSEMVNRLAEQRRTFGVEGFKIDADISSLNIGSAYQPNDRVNISVDILNTGNVNHRFYVGFSISAPDGNIIDISPNSLSLDSEKTDRTSFSWSIPKDAPIGSYEAIIAVWQDKSGSDLVNRLDEQRRTFSVGLDSPPLVPGRIGGEITFFSVDSGQYRQGERVSSVVNVRDTSEPSQGLVVGFSVRDPNERWYDVQPQFMRYEDEQKYFDWVIPPDAPAGCYLARTAVYEGQENNELVGKLDYEEIACAFEVKKTQSGQISLDIKIDNSRSYNAGETVAPTLVITNGLDSDATTRYHFQLFDPRGNLIRDDVYLPFTIGSGDREEVDIPRFYNVDENSPAGTYTLTASLIDPSSNTRISNEVSRTFGVVSTGTESEEAKNKEGEVKTATEVANDVVDTQPPLVPGPSPRDNGKKLAIVSLDGSAAIKLKNWYEAFGYQVEIRKASDFRCPDSWFSGLICLFSPPQKISDYSFVMYGDPNANRDFLMLFGDLIQGLSVEQAAELAVKLSDKNYGTHIGDGIYVDVPVVITGPNPQNSGLTVQFVINAPNDLIPEFNQEKADSLLSALGDSIKIEDIIEFAPFYSCYEADNLFRAQSEDITTLALDSAFCIVDVGLIGATVATLGAATPVTVPAIVTLNIERAILIKSGKVAIAEAIQAIKNLAKNIAEKGLSKESIANAVKRGMPADEADIAAIKNIARKGNLEYTYQHMLGESMPDLGITHNMVEAAMKNPDKVFRGYPDPKVGTPRFIFEKTFDDKTWWFVVEKYADKIQVVTVRYP